MARKNIFEIMERDINIQDEYEKIVRMIAEEECVDFDDYSKETLENVIESLFRDWPLRRNFTSFEELRTHLGLDYTVSSDHGVVFSPIPITTGSFLCFSELLLNIFEHFKNSFRKPFKQHKEHVVDTIKADIELLGHECHIKTDGSLICIPIDPAALSAAEIVDDTYVDPILEYHHQLLKGDIDKKRDILSRLYIALEGRRSEIKAFNSKLADDLFFLQNSLNLRHDNSKNGPPNRFSPAFEAMDKSKIEEWYDETFQVCLLSFLALDHDSRHKDINVLKSTNSQGKKRQNAP
ncbi:MAG: hypothetical protein ACOX7B_09220 [Christensenellales bacterium]